MNRWLFLSAATAVMLGCSRTSPTPSESSANTPHVVMEPPKKVDKTSNSMLSEAVLRVGEPAPPIYLKSLLQAPAGASANIERLKGKAIVLEFWATWCGPCVAQFPHLNELVKQTEEEAIVFLAITEEPVDKVTEFLKKKPLSTWVGIDDKGLTNKAYRVKALPMTVLIDSQGIVRAATHPIALTPVILKNLAKGNPVEIKQEAQLMPVATAGEPGFREATYLVNLGPPNPRIGTPMAGPTMAQSCRSSVRSILCACYGRSLAGSDAHRVLFEDNILDAELGYQVRVPPQSGLVPLDLLQQALESSYGVRAVRQQRDMDVLILKHEGPKKPAKRAGNPEKLGSRMMGNDTFVLGENEPIASLVGWIARRSGKPVIDETRLEGTYDWEVRVKSEKLEDLNAGLAKLGLSLQPDRRRLEVIVVRKAAAEAKGK